MRQAARPAEDDALKAEVAELCKVPVYDAEQGQIDRAAELCARLPPEHELQGWLQRTRQWTAEEAKREEQLAARRDAARAAAAEKARKALLARVEDFEARLLRQFAVERPAVDEVEVERQANHDAAVAEAERLLARPVAHWRPEDVDHVTLGLIQEVPEYATELLAAADCAWAYMRARSGPSPARSEASRSEAPRFPESSAARTSEAPRSDQPRVGQSEAPHSEARPAGTRPTAIPAHAADPAVRRSSPRSTPTAQPDELLKKLEQAERDRDLLTRKLTQLEQEAAQRKRAAHERDELERENGRLKREMARNRGAPKPAPAPVLRLVPPTPAPARAPVTVSSSDYPSLILAAVAMERLGSARAVFKAIGGNKAAVFKAVRSMLDDKLLVPDDADGSYRPGPRARRRPGNRPTVG
jgi:hypothetical protein